MQLRWRQTATDQKATWSSPANARKGKASREGALKIEVQRLYVCSAGSSVGGRRAERAKSTRIHFRTRICVGFGRQSCICSTSAVALSLCFSLTHPRCLTLSGCCAAVRRGHPLISCSHAFAHVLLSKRESSSCCCTCTREMLLLRVRACLGAVAAVSHDAR